MTSSQHPPGATLLSYVMGLLGDAHAHGVRVHARSCRRCGPQVGRLRHQSARLAFALEPVEPPPLLRDSLLQASGEIHRLSPMAKRVGRLLGLGHKQAVALLTRLDQPHFWQSEGKVWLLRLQGSSPGLFLRLAAGHRAQLAPHRAQLTDASHPRCRFLMLQGSAVDEGGFLWRSGHCDWSAASYLDALQGCDVIMLMCPERSAFAPTPLARKSEAEPRRTAPIKIPKAPDSEGLH